MKLKVLSLNCCSLIIRSSGKRALFQSLVDEHSPDIICGCESHLDGTYYNDEIFPSTYITFRKDRVEGVGGVFLCIKESLNISEEPELDVNVEVIWAKLSPSNRAPIYICSFYCPPDLSSDPLMQLILSINRITQRSADLPNIILTGDFNLPSIEWLDGSGQLNSNPTYGVELNNLFLNDTGLEQFVTTPTRNDNILDLVLPTSPNVIDLNVTPGMYDHEAVVFYFGANSENANTKSEHKVALYHKANLENIKENYLSSIIFSLNVIHTLELLNKTGPNLRVQLLTVLQKMCILKLYVLILSCYG